MFDFIKKSLLFGVGAVTITKEKAEKVVNELVEKGQVSKGEASKLLNDLVEKGEQERKAISETIKVEIEKVKKDIGIVDKNKLEELEKRIIGLEELINRFESKKEGE